VRLEAFGVKNLRCLTDTGLVPIRPITVLVGRNSSGKSTFLRAFPLLRQSVETARNSPILWYHERYVDFGSFLDAANNKLNEPSVTFQFRLGLSRQSEVAIDAPALDIAMTLAGSDVPYLSAYDIRVDEHRLMWHFDAQGQVREFSFDGEIRELKGSFSLGGKACFLPNLNLPGKNVALSYWVAPDNRHWMNPDVPRHWTSGLTPEDIGRRGPTVSRMLIDMFDRLLAQYMSHVAYLRPLRVSPERAYRIQNLAVDEVDPDGKNLPMFLHSLSPTETESFAAFTRGALGFETQVRTTGLHAEVLVKEGKAKRFVNLVDVGFGYSEVMPLAAVLWGSCIRPKVQGREPAPLVAIEQPELHLHPAHQAKLARMLVDAASQSGSCIVVETHSESLINGLGKLVYEGLIKAEDVQIAVFDKDDETEETKVSLAGYDADGALRDWPYGFLSPVGWRRAPPAAAE
jgi:predicted ATPase